MASMRRGGDLHSKNLCCACIRKIETRVVETAERSNREGKALEGIDFSPSGDVHEFVGILMDVTERRRADGAREIARGARRKPRCSHEPSALIGPRVLRYDASLRKACCGT
jgi:hypothetical protein